MIFQVCYNFVSFFILKIVIECPEEALKCNYLFQEILINTKTFHFHSSINHQEHFFRRTLISSYFRPVNIAKFLRRAFLQNIFRSSRLQMFCKIGAENGFANFPGKHVLKSLFKWLYWKKTPRQGLFREVW